MDDQPMGEHYQDSSSFETGVGCGVLSCPCHALIQSYSPQGIFSEFPYLGPSDEEGHPLRVFRLQRQYEELVDSFQQLVTQALCMVRYKKVEPKNLVASLEKIDATRPYGDQDVTKQQLYGQLLGMLRSSDSLEDIFDAIYPYFTPFTYHVLTDILVAYGDTSVKQFYVQKLNYFNQRPITSAPRILNPPRKNGFSFLRIFASWDPSQHTLHELEAFRLAASTAFKMTHYPLLLIGVEMNGGVMVMLFQLPSFLKGLILPLDANQKSLLTGKNVLRVEICGQHEMTRSGERLYEKLLQEKFDFSGTAMDDNEFVTPPSSPPPSIKTVPLIGTDNFSLNQTEANLTSHHFELTRPGFEQQSYIAYVVNSSENGKLMAMLLCQHIEAMTSTRDSPKILVVVNTFRRAWQLYAELKELLPLGDIKCITGADSATVSEEFKHTQTTITMVTAGRLLSELQDGKVTFKPITLLLLDEASGIHHETALQDLVQLYSEARRLDKIGRRAPQMVAFTSQPNSGIFALSERSMQDHLIGVCALTEASGGLLVTPQVHSEVFVHQETEVAVTTVHIRWRRFDIPALLCVEMSRIEREVGVVYTLERWNQHYIGFVQEKRSSVPQDDPDRDRLLALYDLLPIYCRAVEISKRQSPEEVGPFLEENRPKFDQNSTSKALESYDRLCNEYNGIIKYEVAVETEVSQVLSEKFSENNEWRGYLFIDSNRDPLPLTDEISSTVNHARPTILSGKYISISKLNKKRKDIEIIEGFEREDSRLIVTQFEIEKFDNLSLIDLPTCNFIVRLHSQRNELTRNSHEEEYIITLVSCYKRKSVQELSLSLQSTLLERAIASMPDPEGDEFKGRMVLQQRAMVRIYTGRNATIMRHYAHRKPQSKKVPKIYQISLRCKKCKVYVCHGNQIFMLFIDGAKNYVVPHYEFRQKISVKRLRVARKVPKQISRLQKMYCTNCQSEWGHICFFPKRGIELPVLRAKHFLFELRNGLHKIKMWSDASFYVPALGACTKYFGEDSDTD